MILSVVWHGTFVIEEAAKCLGCKLEPHMKASQQPSITLHNAETAAQYSVSVIHKI